MELTRAEHFEEIGNKYLHRLALEGKTKVENYGVMELKDRDSVLMDEHTMYECSDDDFAEVDIYFNDYTGEFIAVDIYDRRSY